MMEKPLPAPDTNKKKLKMGAGNNGGKVCSFTCPDKKQNSQEPVP
jgi:hypothetical protein